MPPHKPALGRDVWPAYLWKLSVMTRLSGVTDAAAVDDEASTVQNGNS